MSGAGSLVLSTELTTVYSSIDTGGNGYNSSIAANDNILVLATNVDTISAYSGALSVAINAGKGLGASIVVNTINGTTSAGSTTRPPTLTALATPRPSTTASSRTRSIRPLR